MVNKEEVIDLFMVVIWAIVIDISALAGKIAVRAHIRHLHPVVCLDSMIRVRRRDHPEAGEKYAP